MTTPTATPDFDLVTWMDWREDIAIELTRLMKTDWDTAISLIDHDEPMMDMYYDIGTQPLAVARTLHDNA